MTKIDDEETEQETGAEQGGAETRGGKTALKRTPSGEAADAKQERLNSLTGNCTVTLY